MSIRTEPCLCLDDPCQECCPHDETDHGVCLDCGADRMDALILQAERFYEVDR